MPTRYSSCVYKSPDKFLDACASSLLATREVAANLALASTYALAAERPSQECEDNIWLSITAPDEPDVPKLVLTLSIVGKLFPAALASSLDPHNLAPSVLEEATTALASAVDAIGLPTARLTAVVGPRALADPFVDAWAALRGLKRNPKPLLHMYLSFVTSATLRAPIREPTNMHVGLAQLQDLDEISRMCHAFAARGSHPMTEQMAASHAKSLIDGGQLYACTVDGELLGITAATRPTPGVRAISKVWTNEVARGKGIAEAMVREVCKR